MQLPAYQLLNNALQSLDFGDRASELHGFLCGAVALDISYPLDTCISTLAPDLSHVVTSEELNDLLADICEVVRAQMTDPVLQLELLLPDSDSIDLTTRVTALASWCDGFLFGLANAGLQAQATLPDDTSEILLDLTRISQLHGADTGEEDEEVSYNELLEYVRMSALLVAEELQPIKMTTELQ
ncbi:MAG: UPF0149 family protein [Gammaproteobacteria bacterium]|nr:UPF0149 family protein [Gammaproteobacteria bacterium]